MAYVAGSEVATHSRVKQPLYSEVQDGIVHDDSKVPT